MNHNIALYKSESPGAFAGGIVNCDSSIFRDNVCDVVFLPYRNYATGQPSTEYPNQSRFTQVHFIV